MMQQMQILPSCEWCTCAYSLVWIMLFTYTKATNWCDEVAVSLHIGTADK